MGQTRLEEAFGLQGKTALITGGGTGLGYAIAECMAAAGAQVVIAGRREDVLKEACGKIGNGAAYVRYDVTDREEAPKLAEQILAQYGHLDILVNNAGIHCKKPVQDVQYEDLLKVMDTHLFGAYALTQAFLPHMRERRSGNIQFISSMSAFIGLTNVSAYAAAKGAVTSLVRAMAGEISDQGIRVNGIVPGFIDTPMFRQVTEQDLPRKEKILGHTPMKCFGTPEDIGWAAVYLASQASGFVTGTMLMVDGGCATGF